MGKIKTNNKEGVYGVELINEEKICYMQLKGLMNFLRSKNLISLLEGGEIRKKLTKYAESGLRTCAPGECS